MAFLTRKLGPLPLWGYGLLGVGGIAYLRWRKGRQAQQPAPSQIPVALGDMSVLPQEPGADLGGFQLPISNVPTSATPSTSQGTFSGSGTPTDVTNLPNLAPGTSVGNYTGGTYTGSNPHGPANAPGSGGATTK